MQKHIIIYKGKYGATQQYAEWLGEDLGLPVMVSDNTTKVRLQAADCIILGTSVYIGKLLINDWLKRNIDQLKHKKLYLFVVCGNNSAKAQESIVRQNVPRDLIDNTHIYFLPGRLIFSRLSWKDKLILKLGAMQAKNPETRKQMLRDKDDVKREKLAALIAELKATQSATV